MDYLLDTGILLRVFPKNEPQREVIRQILRQLRQRGDNLFTTTQNIAEFWNVSTRPLNARGGYGRDIQSTSQRLHFLNRLVKILSEPDDAYPIWRELVEQHNVRGVAVHDCRLVATMKSRRIDRIITLNVKDFARYDGIVAETPAEIISALSA